MISSLLDACRLILELQGEAQTSYWLASQIMEMKMWRATESGVSRALNNDIKRYGESSRFVKVGEDEYALRIWNAKSK